MPVFTAFFVAVFRLRTGVFVFVAVAILQI